jgi:hypothetical protein
MIMRALQAMTISACVAGVAACASVPDEPSTEAAPVAQAEQPGGAAEPVASVPVDASENVVEQVATVSATLEPPQLRLAFDGRCRDIGVSVVGEDTFVHWMADYERGVLRRVGDAVETLDEIAFDARLKDGEYAHEPTGILDVGGSWPDRLWVAGDHSFRDFQASRLYAYEGGAWRRSNALGKEADFSRVWSWIDDSVLAFATQYDAEGHATPRLAVVHGRGKGPSMSGVLGRAGCGGENAEALDVAVAADGHVAAVVRCKSTWLATWAPGDRDGGSVRLGGGDVERARLALHREGRGWVSLARGKRIALHRVDGEAVTAASLPEGAAVRAYDLDAQGRAWLATSAGVYAPKDDGWIRDGAEVDVDRIDGAVTGIPWILRDRELAVRTTDGVWHDVTRPESKAVPGKVPKVLDVVVVGPGDAFVVGETFKIKKGTKHVGTRFSSVMSTRAIETPHGC